MSLCWTSTTFGRLKRCGFFLDGKQTEKKQLGTLLIGWLVGWLVGWYCRYVFEKETYGWLVAFLVGCLVIITYYPRHFKQDLWNRPHRRPNKNMFVMVVSPIKTQEFTLWGTHKTVPFCFLGLFSVGWKGSAPTPCDADISKALTCPRCPWVASIRLSWTLREWPTPLGTIVEVGRFLTLKLGNLITHKSILWIGF